MLTKTTFTSIVLFLDTISQLDVFLKTITFVAYMIYMYVAIIEKISTIKKGGYLTEYGGSWKRYIYRTSRDFFNNLFNNKDDGRQ